MFSYDGRLTKALDRIRFTINDRFADSEMLSDEEINALITTHGEDWAAVFACEQIATQLGLRGDTRIGQTAQDLGKAADYYWELSKTLRKRLVGKSSAAFLSSFSDNDVPIFTRELHNYT